MAFWFPESIQKRLLVYILQQLTLFSDLDLDNIDVSLGSKSEFSFTDLNLKVDDLAFDYAKVESAHVDRLDIKLEVNGFLSIWGQGLKVGLNPDPMVQDVESMVMTFSKNIKDLADSIMEQSFYSNSDDVPESSDASQVGSDMSERSNGNHNETSTGTFQSMKNKVINKALSGLKFTFEDTSIKINFNNLGMRDHGVFYREMKASDSYVVLYLKETTLATVEGNSKKLNINDLRISFYSNTSSDLDQSLTTSEQSNEDLAKSMFYSKADAASIYMSAMEDLTTKEGNSEEETRKAEINLMSGEDITISFDGFSSLDDLVPTNFNVIADKLHLSLTNIIRIKNGGLAEMFAGMRSSNRTKENKAEGLKLTKSKGYQRFVKENAPSISHTSMYIQMNEVTVALTDNANLKFEDITLLKDDLYFKKLNINDAKLINNHDEIITHVNPFMEIICTDSKLHVSVIADMNLNIKEVHLGDIIQVIKDIDQFKDFYLNRNNSKRDITRKDKQSRYNYQVKTRAVTVNLDLNDSMFILSLKPIYFDSTESNTKCAGIDAVWQKNGFPSPVINLQGIEILSSSKRQPVDSFDDNSAKCTLHSDIVVRTKKLIFRGDFETLIYIHSDLRARFEDIMKSPYFSFDERRVNEPFTEKKGHTILSTLGSSKISPIAYLILLVDNIDLSLVGVISKEFGTLDLKLKDMLFAFFVDSTLRLICTDLDIRRIIPKVLESQQLLASSENDGVSTPALLLSFDGSYKLRLKIFDSHIHYHATLLDIFIEPSASKKKSPETNGNSLMAYQRNVMIDVRLINCLLLLHPYRIKSCLLIFSEQLYSTIKLDVRKITLSGQSGTLHLIDEFSDLGKYHKYESIPKFLGRHGYSLVGKIQNFKINSRCDSEQPLDVDIMLDRILLSVCADSFHTLCQLFADLKRPQSFPDNLKYKLSADDGLNLFDDIEDDEFASSHIKKTEHVNDTDKNMHIVDMYLDDLHVSDIETQEPQVIQNNSYDLEDVRGNAQPAITDELTSTVYLEEDYFDMKENHKSSSTLTYSTGPVSKTEIHIAITLNNIRVKMFDGYDWKYTRKRINEELDKICYSETDNDFVSVMEPPTTLFDSIYIQRGAPDLRDTMTENIQGDTKPESDKNGNAKADLKPSKYCKTEVVLSDIVIVSDIFQQLDSKVVSSGNDAFMISKTQLLVGGYEVIDKLPTSTWNKFITLLKSVNWPVNRPMLNLDLNIVKPIEQLEAFELIIGMTVAPLRLHIDQETLEFLSRFMEFKDTRFELIDEYPYENFIQKFQINPINLKIDYKPKAQLDYSALRSGHAKELAKLFTLDGSNILLKPVILYGLNGFSDLSCQLQGIWSPDIKSKQIKGVLEGIAPFKTFFTFSGGMKSLVTVLFNTKASEDEKQSDSSYLHWSESCNIFVRTTTGEFIKLGVKLASGTQNILETAEEYLGGPGSRGRNQFNMHTLQLNTIIEQDQQLIPNYNEIRSSNKYVPGAIIIDNYEDNIPKVVSLYADQPLDVHQGLEEAYSSLEKHMHIAYETLWARKDNAGNKKPLAAAINITKWAPIAIIRPLIGATEAVGKTLQGISNRVDKNQIDSVRDKYKSYQS